MEKLDKVIAGLECCTEERCKGCPYLEHEQYCMGVLEKDALEMLKDYRELMERNTWPCWQCEYAWMKFRKYKIMFGPDNCDVHRDKMCPVLDKEVADD